MVWLGMIWTPLESNKVCNSNGWANGKNVFFSFSAWVTRQNGCLFAASAEVMGEGMILLSCETGCYKRGWKRPNIKRFWCCLSRLNDGMAYWLVPCGLIWLILGTEACIALGQGTGYAGVLPTHLHQMLLRGPASPATIVQAAYKEKISGEIWLTRPAMNTDRTKIKTNIE